MKNVPQSVKDALADAETLRLNDSRYDWIGRVPMLLAAGADVTAAKDAEREAREVFALVPGLAGVYDVDDCYCMPGFPGGSDVECDFHYYRRLEADRLRFEAK